MVAERTMRITRRLIIVAKATMLHVHPHTWIQCFAWDTWEWVHIKFKNSSKLVDHALNEYGSNHNSANTLALKYTCILCVLRLSSLIFMFCIFLFLKFILNISLYFIFNCITTVWISLVKRYKLSYETVVIILLQMTGLLGFLFVNFKVAPQAYTRGELAGTSLFWRPNTHRFDFAN